MPTTRGWAAIGVAAALAILWLAFGEVPGALTLLGGTILMLAIAGNALAGLRRKPVPVL